MTKPSTLKIDDVEYVRADSITPLGNTEGTPFWVGKSYLIRTVTMCLTGRVVGVVGQFLVITEAAWIADTGRFNVALAKGTLDEVEPATGNVFVGLGSIVDVYEWNHPLLRVAK
jgi:hypothetical protein